eukprot:NODE_455_length_8260_cov_0.408406.p1 type:complete len:1734 gc:universal NODE_455_length_8260_cov_0.408406:2814-8015(+)
METLFTQFLQDKELKNCDFDIFIKRRPAQVLPIIKQLKDLRHQYKSFYKIEDSTLDKWFKRYNESALLLLIFIHPWVSIEESIVHDYMKAVLENPYASDYKKGLCYNYIIYCLDSEELLGDKQKSLKAIRLLILHNKFPNSSFSWTESNFSLSIQNPYESIANIKIQHAVIEPKVAAKYLLDLFFNTVPSIQFLIKQMLPSIITPSIWDALYNHLVLYNNANVDIVLRKYVLIFLLKSAATSSRFTTQLQLLWPLLHDTYDSWSIINYVDKHYSRDFHTQQSKTRQLLLGLIPSVALNKTAFLILLTDHMFCADGNSQLKTVLSTCCRDCGHWLEISNAISEEDIAIYNHKNYYPVKDVLNIQAIKDVKDRELRFKQVNQKLIKLNPKDSELLNQQIHSEESIRNHVQSTIDSCPLSLFIDYFDALLELPVKSINLPCVRSLFDNYALLLLLPSIFNIKLAPLIAFLNFVGLKSYSTNLLIIKYTQMPFDDPSDLFLSLTEYSAITNCIPIIASCIQLFILNNQLLPVITKYLSNNMEICLHFNNIPFLLPSLFNIADKSIVLKIMQQIISASTVHDELVCGLLKLYDSPDESNRSLVVDCVPLLNCKHEFIYAFNDMLAVAGDKTKSVVPNTSFINLYNDSATPFIWNTISKYISFSKNSKSLISSYTLEYSTLVNTQHYRQSNYNRKAFLLTKLYYLLLANPDCITATLSSFVDKNEINDEEMYELFTEYFSSLIKLNKSTTSTLLPYLQSILQNNNHLLIIQWIGQFYLHLSNDQCLPIFKQLIVAVSLISNEQEQITASKVFLNYWDKVDYTEFVSVKKQSIMQMDVVSIRSKALLLATWAKSKRIKYYTSTKNDDLIIEYSNDANENCRLFSLKLLDYHSLLFNRLYEPYIIKHLLICLQGFGDVQSCRVATNLFMKRILPKCSLTTFKLMIPKCLLLISNSQWRIRNGCCLLLLQVALLDPVIITDQLSFIIPALTTATNDSHYQVSASATNALTEYTNAIHVPELKQHAHSILKALGNDEYLDSCFSDLLATTFTHSVDVSSFALLLPLLTKGLHVNKHKDVLIRSSQLIGSLTNICTMEVINTYFIDLLPKLKELTNMALPEIRAYACKAYGSIVNKLPNKMEYLHSILTELQSTSNTNGIAQLTSELFYANGIESLTTLFPMIHDNCTKYAYNYTMLLNYLPMTFSTNYTALIPDTLDCLTIGLTNSNNSVVELAIKGALVLIQQYPNIDLLLPPIIELMHTAKLQSFQLLMELIVATTNVDINSKNTNIQSVLQSKFAGYFNTVCAHVYCNRFDEHLNVRSICTLLWKLIILDTGAILPIITSEILDILCLFTSEQASAICIDINTKYKEFYKIAMDHAQLHDNIELIGILVPYYPHVDIEYITRLIAASSDSESSIHVISKIIKNMPGIVDDLLKLNTPWIKILPLLPEYYEQIIDQYPAMLMEINDELIVNNNIQYIFTRLTSNTGTLLTLSHLFKRINESTATTLVGLVAHELHHHRHVLLCCLILQVLCDIHSSVIYAQYWSIFNNLIINDNSEILNTVNSICMCIPRNYTTEYCLKFATYITSALASHQVEHVDYVQHMLLSNYTSIYRDECIEAVYMTSIKHDNITMGWIGPLIRVLPDCNVIGYKLMLYYMTHCNIKPFLPQLHRVLLKANANNDNEVLDELTSSFISKHTRAELFIKELNEIKELRSSHASKVESGIHNDMLDGKVSRNTRDIES